jgi:ring-1,2-phenylacetyl-CoA epoxidase subunit PaaB
VSSEADTQFTLWEVFVQEKIGAPHTHAGSVHAADAELALQNARDTFARRDKLVSIWVVEAERIAASRADDAPGMFEPGPAKIYRHPRFYRPANPKQKP